MKRILARGRLRIGRCRHQQRIIADLGHRLRKRDRVLGPDSAGAADQCHTPGNDILRAAKRFHPLLDRMDVIFTRCAADNDSVNAGRDQMLEDRVEATPVN